jgi:2-oxoisovalerate dehydrogenase E1 component
VDGNDVLAVHAAAGEAVARARAGEGPTLLECVTYRTRAHSEGMRDTGYRTQEEIDSWKARCPIEQFRQRLLSSGAATQADFDRIEAETKALIDEAAEFANNSPWPDPATASHHVFSHEP